LLRCAGIELALDNGTRVWGKLEFLQRTGTFKARGALANLHALSREQLDKGCKSSNDWNSESVSNKGLQILWGGGHPG
jgi:hypothetical protein